MSTESRERNLESLRLIAIGFAGFVVTGVIVGGLLALAFWWAFWKDMPF